MTTLKDFIETFKGYNNSELILRVDNPNQYQPLAVQAASIVLSSRNLSTEELENARNEIKQKEKFQIEYSANKRQLTNQRADKIISKLFPIQKNNGSVDIVINILSYLYFAILIVMIVNNIKLIDFIVDQDESKMDIPTYLHFVESVLLLITLPLFFLRKRTGWFLFLAYMVNSLILTLAIVGKDATNFLQLLFPVGVLIIFCRPSFINAFKVEKSEIKKGFILGLFLAFIVFYLSS
jgi:hypothetical protein